MKTPAEMLYRLLSKGGRIEHDGCLYAMDEAGGLCVIMHNVTEGKEHPVSVDCDLVAFKTMSEEIGRDKIWLKLCEMRIKQTEG